MGRNVGSAKGDNRTKDGGNEGALQRRERAASLEHIPNPQAPLASRLRLHDNLLWFASEWSGWLRWIPDQDNDVLYLKWKFSRGPHGGYYVMVRVQPWQYDYGLDLLRSKVQEVYEGVRKPTLDKLHEVS